MLTVGMAVLILVSLCCLLTMVLLVGMTCRFTMAVTFFLGLSCFFARRRGLEEPFRRIKVAARTPTDRMLTIAITVLRLELGEEFVFMFEAQRFTGQLVYRAGARDLRRHCGWTAAGLGTGYVRRTTCAVHLVRRGS